MNSIEDCAKFTLNAAYWQEAYKRAKQRIANEYKRDVRLNDDERTHKIAVGYIGEFAMVYWAKKQNIALNYLGDSMSAGPDHGDFSTPAGLIIDVKTQEVRYAPQADWRCEVTGGQKLRPADIYVFTKLHIMQEQQVIYLAGWMDKTSFFNSAQHREPGALLKNKPVHYDKWDLPIHALKSMKELSNYLNVNPGEA